MTEMYKSQFFLALDQYCRQFGGIFNAHAHADRFSTLLESMEAQGAHDNPLTSYSLWDKVTAIETLHHGNAYSRSSLTERINRFLSKSEACGIRRVDSFVDIDTDIELSDGMGALEIALDLKKQYKDRLDFRVGAYVPSGFRKNDRQKQELFESAIKIADFIGTSPERDDSQFYPGTSDHIGLKHHFEWTLDLAVSNNKPVHYHLDQQISPLEKGTEGLIGLLESSSLGDLITKAGEHEPLVWAVHAISPSTYNHARLQKMIGKMAQLNIGLICCPSAAISMRKLPIFDAPIHKSIAEVLPMLHCGIHTRLGTDNVDDIFLPANSLDLRHEIATLTNALRFYNVPIIAKLACGKELSPDDKNFISQHLKYEEKYLNEFKVVQDFPI